MGPLAIKSVVDVGCGKGVSTDYFRKKGAHVLCVEGSHDAVTQSLLPAEVIVEHDFSRGPWWPSDTYDALWSVEFLEHVGRHHMPNYLPIFHKAALIFVTSSAWGGWHHVEVHEEWWWRNRLIAAGFVYSEDLTALARQQAVNAARTEREAQHLKFRLLVFLNPRCKALHPSALLLPFIYIIAILFWAPNRLTYIIPSEWLKTLFHSYQHWFQNCGTTSTSASLRWPRLFWHSYR